MIGAGAMAGAARRGSAAALVLCLALALAGGPGRAACDYASLEEARALAERAAAHLERVGPERAFADFMDRSGGFIDRDLYVFVIDLDATMLVNGGFPEVIGSNIAAAQDSRGRFFAREMIASARRAGHGYVEYDWYSPCTGKMSPKVTFFKRVGNFIVAVGAYGTMSA